MKRKIFSVLFALVLVLSLGLVTAVPASADVLIVGPAQYTTIQEAINAADPGDIINVEGGPYAENIDINKMLTLQGIGDSSPIIQGSGGTVVTISADGVVIDGFTITNPSGKCGISAQDQSNITITNNTVTDVGSSDGTASGTNQGIAIISSAAAVDNIIIVGNDINTIVGGIGRSAQGIVIGHTDGFEAVTGLLIQDNVIANITSATVPFASGGRGAYGIMLSHGTAGGQTVGAQVLDNTISYLEGLWAHGIGLEGNTPGALVSGNTISYLFDYKYPSDAVAVQVEDNLGATTVTIEYNYFDNVNVGVQNVVAGNPLVTAENNWWGSASGPTHPSNTYTDPAGDLQGSAVNGSVDFVPWLGGPYPSVTSIAPVSLDDPLGQFSSIGAAITAAGGTTITCIAGTYDENVVINKSLTLEGANAGVPATGARGPESIIDAQLVEFAVLITGTDTVATFDGFMVDNYERAGILAGSFTLSEDDPFVVHILNNIVTDPGSLVDQNNNCIQVGDGTTGTIIGNEVFGAHLEAEDWSGSGILVAGSNDVLVENNYAHDCDLGIAIAGYPAASAYRPALDNIVEYNFAENCESGISVQMNSIHTIVRCNDVSNNDVGIESACYSSEEDYTPSGTQIHFNNIIDNTLGVASIDWDELGDSEQVNALFAAIACGLDTNIIV